MTGAAFTFAAFWSLVAFTAASAERRAKLRAKPAREWVLDSLGLIVQGVLVPIVGIAALALLYARIAPSMRGAWHVPWPIAFALSFILVDYVYYWNHRLLHTRALWRIHAVHHTAREMDVFVTSRNTLWTSALIVYLWGGSWFTYALHDASGYLAGAALTSILDLARHTSIDLSRWPRLERLLGAALVLPRDHALHHADLERHGNYAANIVLWDRLHGTYLGARAVPARLGIPHEGSIARALVWPLTK
jgi:sterol desaturase/sphingolipid hydroxylase (fatty acid hydroxylase superfamily)